VVKEVVKIVERPHRRTLQVRQLRYDIRLRLTSSSALIERSGDRRQHDT
jgi:hypothetical protein